MGLVTQSVGPNHFSKLLKYIYEIGFHKYMMNNLKDYTGYSRIKM